MYKMSREKENLFCNILIKVSISCRIKEYIEYYFVNFCRKIISLFDVKIHISNIDDDHIIYEIYWKCIEDKRNIVSRDKSFDAIHKDAIQHI